MRKLFFLLLTLYVMLPHELLSIEKENPLLPLPTSIEFKDGHDFTINSRTSIQLQSEAIVNYEQIKDVFLQLGISFNEGARLRSKNVLFLQLDTSLVSLTEEGYIVDVCKDIITVKSSSHKGLYYGVITLSQLVAKDADGKTWTIPGVYIEDKPRFKWRGFMIDVSRQFFELDVLKQYVDWLALHKMNIFHLHLTDDQGWRVHINKYPDLTLKGAWRGKNEVLRPSFGSNDERYGGFYSQQQLRELVKYAADRNIDILPEIDIPGHSRAVLAVYPHLGCSMDSTIDLSSPNVYCLYNEDSYSFIMDILTEIADIFPFEYIHIGGDEVNHKFWKSCENCSEIASLKHNNDYNGFQNEFIGRIEKGLTQIGKQMIGWNEILNCGNHLPTTTIMAWEDLSKCSIVPKCGHNVILSPQTHYYLDKRQGAEERGWFGEMITTEDVYLFDPGMEDILTLQEQDRILGIQGNLWSERLSNPYKFDQYQTFPRLCAIAEAAWTEQKHRSWESFSHRMLNYHFSRLDNMGIKYRFFTPSYSIENGFIAIQSLGSGVIIRYTVDGLEPDENSQIYTEPIDLKDVKVFNYKAYSSTGYPSPVVLVRFY